MTAPTMTTPADHMRATRYCLALIASHRGDNDPLIKILDDLNAHTEELRIPLVIAALAEMVIGTVGQMHGPEKVESQLSRALAATTAAADQHEAARQHEA